MSPEYSRLLMLLSPLLVVLSLLVVLLLLLLLPLLRLTPLAVPSTKFDDDDDGIAVWDVSEIVKDDDGRLCC